jgi:hypothetical protein
VPSLYRAPDGTLGVAYGSDKLGNKHIYFSSSRDGQTWSPAAPVQPGDLSDQDPALFADSRGFHVVFASNRENPNWAMYVSDHSGGQWTAPERLNLPGSMTVEPAVCTTPHGWALTYRSLDGLVVAESGDGHTWYQAKVAATHLGDPAIAYVGGKLTIVAHRSGQLFEIERETSGAWTAAKPLGFGNPALQPALSVDSAGTLNLAFSFRTGGPGTPTQLSTSSKVGGRWSAPEPLTSGTGDNVNPTLQILPDGGRAFAWGISGSSGDRGIVFAKLSASLGVSTTYYGGYPTNAPGGSK